MLGPLAVFLAGLAGTGALMAPAVYPARTYQAWCQVRYGSVPSAEGLLLSLGQAPRELEGGAGPEGVWMLLELQNVSDRDLAMFYAERVGDEFGFEVRDENGDLLPLRSGPEQATRVSAIHRAVLPARGEPGGRLAFLVDLASRVKLPDRGRYTVVATRVPFAGDRHLCRSNPTKIRLD